MKSIYAIQSVFVVSIGILIGACGSSSPSTENQISEDRFEQLASVRDIRAPAEDASIIKAAENASMKDITNIVGVASKLPVNGQNFILVEDGSVAAINLQSDDQGNNEATGYCYQFDAQSEPARITAVSARVGDAWRIPESSMEANYEDIAGSIVIAFLGLAINEKQISAALEQYTTSAIEYHGYQTVRGTDDTLAEFDKSRFNRSAYDVKRLIIKKDMVAVCAITYDDVDGELVQLSVLDVFKIENGKIAKYWHLQESPQT